jgi:hypothetical protein
MLLTDNYRALERRPDDVYETPHWLIEAALELVSPPPLPAILDVHAGDGRWGTAAIDRWPDCHIEGVEKRPLPRPSGFDGWHSHCLFPECAGDFRRTFDLILGNPSYQNVEATIRAGWDLLAPAGTMLFLLPLRFLASQSRRDGLFREIPPKSVTVCSKRPSFQADGKTNATDFGLFLWSRCWRGTPALKWLKETNGT